MAIPDELRSAVLALPDRDRRELAALLLSTVDSEVARSPDDARLQELQRRRDEFLCDRSAGILWSELRRHG